MSKPFKNIYQFKITLKESKPLIWRRIQIPDTYTFWDFHVAIQDSMGWKDSHLHQFDIMNPKTLGNNYIGIPDEEGWDDIIVIPGWKKKISLYFSLQNPKAEYEYDFGDCWMHKIELEKILPPKKDVFYPRCMQGKRACPPEDCGGVCGYESFLDILKDPTHSEHARYIEWSGGSFDPEVFNPKEIEFDDPQKRYDFAFLQ